jgi:stage III sporulation protein AH
MKKIFKKNQLIITGLALMIAAAGYLSYSNTGLKNDTKETASKKEVKEEYEISDEDSKSEEIFTDTEASEEVADASQATSETSAEGMSEEEAKSANPGEAVLTSTGAETVNFAAEAKLSREQVRSKNKESLLEIINNKELEEASRQSAIEQMVKMTDTAEKEEAAEMLLEAKGFSNVVVSITDDSADVVLDMGKDATDAKRAQVEDIVKRKTGVSAQNIIITPVDSSAKTQTEK